MGVISQGVLAASQNIGMFIAFRFFTGFVAYGLLMLCKFVLGIEKGYAG